MDFRDVFTGNEIWIKKYNQGETIWATTCGDGPGFPVIDVCLDIGLIKIDVMGMSQVCDARMVDFRIGWDGDVVEDIYEQDKQMEDTKRLTQQERNI